RLAPVRKRHKSVLRRRKVVHQVIGGHRSPLMVLGRANPCGRAITFQRAVNLDVALGDRGYNCRGGLLSGKKAILREQKGVVARPSQLRTIHAPALPPSNQIEATLFDEGRNDDEWGSSYEENFAWRSRHYCVCSACLRGGYPAAYLYEGSGLHGAGTGL